RLVPYGPDVSGLVYALGFANRAALSFGGVTAGDYKGNLRYNKNRIFAFVLALDKVNTEKYAMAAGAINYGFPTIADTPIPEILPTGVCTYEHVVSSVPHDKMVEKALEVRGCKIQITNVPVPVAYGPAFEGERIRKKEVHAEFGGNLTPAFEFVKSVELEDIKDGDIEIIGPDIDSVEEGTALPLAIWVEVAGRKMQPDFEPILERQIHHLVNGAEGIYHMGQRDIVWTRVSKDGFKKGLRLRHYGDILHAKLLSEYPAIVDKVKVTLITELDEVEKRLAFARKIYQERNRRLEAMTDDSVDTFYSCLLCQSFAPDHVCIITPERLGLCGAYNWLDGKAAFEIDETGPNQPVQKGRCLDPVKGIWVGVNDYVYPNSHKTVDTFCAYSIMDRPMTSCGCFEVIAAYVPECNGAMLVNREFVGDTPVGMTFSSLAGSVGGGAQTPGFMGLGKVFVTSRKFLFAEGGHRRIVWMPRELKELLKEDINKRLAEQGVPDMLEKIADETIATDPSEIRAFMEKVGHPAVDMKDMSAFSEIEGKDDDQEPSETTAPIEADGSEDADSPPSAAPAESVGLDAIAQLKAEITASIKQELWSMLTQETADGSIDSLREKFLGQSPAVSAESVDKVQAEPTGPTAAERIGAIEAFEVKKDKVEVPLWTVTLGATAEQGGTRGHTVSVGGASAMPFHLWEGEMPHRPVVAMEVFDAVGDKYPKILRDIYGPMLETPADMARLCVEKYGADLISVRLDSTHPEKGDRSADDAVEIVKSVLEAVDVPLIVTGHSHFDKVNEVMKAVAQATVGENLLLNWAEQDNYRTIAAAALGYNHCLVAQSPIDVNIAKQLNILITNMSVKPEQIVIDAMTGAMGYGVEYTYSVMERIRMTGFGGDKMLAGPMIATPGYECAKIKEYKAPESDFPAWGKLESRVAMWELTTAVSLLYAGADILVMYHPDAAAALKKTINRLMDGN
ncbi:MAG: CO dehydrogenase/CO-methylating acetyl-CoA synthase complex subunit beta, partial [Proteobacteria bacterium]|nr:CO dehydrogenase/CO-methylating acetyl-CoA synthase complex subunit beta [Pseudomonadota bacterium]